MCSFYVTFQSLLKKKLTQKAYTRGTQPKQPSLFPVQQDQQRQLESVFFKEKKLKSMHCFEENMRIIQNDDNGNTTRCLPWLACWSNNRYA